jgi:ATP-binding cassette subfamily B protein
MAPFYKLTKNYLGWVILVSVLGLATNVLALYVPKLSATVIDHVRSADVSHNILALTLVALAAFVVAVLQIYSSTYFSEKVALDLRQQLIGKISNQTFGYVAASTPGRLLTIFTSDTDAVKNVIAQGLVALLGAAVTLVGAAIFLIFINAHLAFITLSVIPFLILSLVLIFGNISSLFRRAQENLENINALMNESIVGAALVRVLHASSYEIRNFGKTNEQSRDIGLAVVKNISALIPIITLLANISTILIVWFGGKQVIGGTLSVGNFSAFLSYSAMFVWPLFVLSFVGTLISRGGVSLKRINDVLDAPVAAPVGAHEGKIKGQVEFKNVSLNYLDQAGAERSVLKDISFVLSPRSKNAIVGPTAAGKTQIFYLMAGIVTPTSGEILIDGEKLSDYKNESLLSQIGLVFQDSIIFNSSFRENVALSENTAPTPDEVLRKALKTAELDSLVASLPSGLDTLVSERGTSLSGGQKQRLMLARALAVEPKILLLDDFTARVDQATEDSILKNVMENYPEVTLVSITQKIEPIRNYDQIIVLMEGELVATGAHEQLLKDSFEYRQIYESQKSTETIA